MHALLTSKTSRLIAAGGACLLVAAQSRWFIAAAFAFGHGLALAVLAPMAQPRLAIAVLISLLVGTVLLCGGLVAATLFGINADVATFGGTLLIVAWLAWAILALRG